MTPDLFPIPGPWRGKLAVVTRPRGWDWLEDEARGWRQAGINSVVSLLEADEAAQLGLAREAELAASNAVRFTSFPIVDRGVPASLAPFQSLLLEIIAELEAGAAVAVHCRQSIGRAGLIAVGVLIMSGVETGRAIATVSAARGLAVPETEAQLRWIENLGERIRSGPQVHSVEFLAPAALEVAE